MAVRRDLVNRTQRNKFIIKLHLKLQDDYFKHDPPAIKSVIIRRSEYGVSGT